MTRDPFDFSELMNMFDPNNMSKMFDPQRIGANLTGFPLPTFDFGAVIERNRKNIEAIQEANKVSVEAFRELHAMQMAIFNELITAAQNSGQSLSRESGKDLVAEQQQILNAAMERAFSLMQESAESVRKANQEAFDIIEDRIMEAIAEISQTDQTKSPATAKAGEKPEEPAEQVASDKSLSSDDLTRIKGIGSVLQGKLNGLGIHTFEHIADLTPADIERINSALDFPGRIERERWVEQAEAILEVSPSLSTTRSLAR